MQHFREGCQEGPWISWLEAAATSTPWNVVAGSASCRAGRLLWTEGLVWYHNDPDRPTASLEAQSGAHAGLPACTDSKHGQMDTPSPKNPMQPPSRRREMLLLCHEHRADVGLWFGKAGTSTAEIAHPQNGIRVKAGLNRAQHQLSTLPCACCSRDTEEQASRKMVYCIKL